MDSFDVYTLAKIYFEYKKKKDKKVVEVQQMFAFVLNRERKKASNRAKKESVIRANKKTEKKSNLNGNKNKSIENLNHLN